jgi:4'-phosphopantetheinyl transferase
VGIRVTPGKPEPVAPAQIGMTQPRIRAWRVDLRAETLALASASPITAEEWERARRFRRGLERQRFLRTRVALRSVLGRELARADRDVAFQLNACGKPELLGDSDLEFNISHAENDLVIAVARGFPIGIDIERETSRVDDRAIAQHFFTRGERRDIEASSPASRHRRFLEIWTAKEAYVKGLGYGLQIDPTSYEVFRTSSALFRVHDLTDSRHSWWVRSLHLAGDVVGALATPIASPPIDWSTWP